MVYLGQWVYGKCTLFIIITEYTATHIDKIHLHSKLYTTEYVLVPSCISHLQ